jgi:hypothetical protein
VQGNLRGPTGAAGAQGPTGATGPAGATGATGAAGQGIAIAGSAATYAALPSGLGSGDAGKGYLVNADGKLYIWDGTAFPPNGSGVAFQGPKGDTGATGATGSAGPQGTAGATGATGATGPTGSTGAAGADGARGTKIFTGSGAPTSVPGSAAGDLYMDVTSGDLYVLS